MERGALHGSAPFEHMTKRVVDYDPISGITTSVDYDPVDDITTVIHEFCELDATMDRTKALQNDDDYTRKGIKGGWWHYAFTPNHLIHKWLVEDGINIYNKQDLPRALAKINSREFRHFKTTGKMHIVRDR